MKFLGLLSVVAATVASTPLDAGLIGKVLELEALQQETVSAPSIWEANKDVVDIHKKLIEIPSVSLAEQSCGAFLSAYFKAKGFTVEDQFVDDTSGRRNVYVYAGDKRDTRLLMTSHIDTVPPFFPYRIEGDKIFGRGSLDAKASVSAQIAAFERLLAEESIEEGDVGLLFDVGEEIGGAGARKAIELGVDWETVVFGEPTGNKLIKAHKGGASAILKATGKAGHSSMPELGINAIELLIDALNDLKKADLPGGDILGPTNFNIGLIEGGVAPNVIPGEAKATLLVRVASENASDVDKVIKDVIAKHERVDFEKYESHSPVFFDYDIRGYEFATMPVGTDAATLTGDFAKYLIGPGANTTLHAADEHVTIQELAQGVETYKDIVLYKLGKKD